MLQAFDRGCDLPENRSDLLFPQTGGVNPLSVVDLPLTAQICSCNGVSKARITEAVQNGASTLQGVCQVTRAGTGCGTCKSQVQAILESASDGSGGGVGGSPFQSPPKPLESVWLGQN